MKYGSKKIYRKMLAVSVAGGLSILLGLALLPRPDLWQGLVESRAYTDLDGKLLRLTLAEDGAYRIRVPLEEISPVLVETTLLHEDRYFYQHPGVNPVALGKALLNECSGNPNRFGASTITMQLARIRFGLNTRNISGKLLQSLRALQLEWHYSKAEILEAYLNQASYGRNIEGVAAAGLIYYGKQARDLNLAEALTLSVIPQSPARRAPRYADESSKGNTALIEARKKLFDRWIGLHPADKKQEAALQMALQVRTPRDLPFLAPHFIDWKIKGNSDGRTGLDLNLQRLCEDRIKSYIRMRCGQGIRNAAALLVDTQTMEVRAAVGSADFFSTEIEGQVNGLTMRRSPGSTLKPLLYALAMDEGLIHPQSLLKDAPMSLAGYNPENYDRDFVGPVSASAALQQSRNVPAVWLGSRLKEKSLHSLLKKCGILGLKEESFYGLTLALGSSEMSMVELAELYGMLANRGNFQKVKTGLRNGEEVSPSQQLISPEASYLVLDMLKQSPRPDLVRSEGLSGRQGSVSWKTGTSWSFRDAWSVAVFDRYVLVIWLGNFNGESNPALVGRQAAAPLLFSIIDSVRARVPAKEKARWESREGLNVEVIEVCALSGGLPCAQCSRKMQSYFIPGISPIDQCTVHRKILVDARTGKRVREKDPGRKILEEVYEVWPSDIRELFRKAGLPRRVIPPYEDLQTAGEEEPGGQDAPVILSPISGVAYLLPAAANGRQSQLAMKANGSGILHWFANARLLGTTKAGEDLFWNPAPGNYTLTVVSASGLSDSESIRVEAAP